MFEKVDSPDERVTLPYLYALQHAATQAIMDKGAGKPPKRPLVHCNTPHKILDAHPEVYRHARGLYAEAGLGAAVDVSEGVPQRLVVGMHVRRAELQLAAPERILPNEHYIGLARRVLDACTALRVPCVSRTNRRRLPTAA